MFFLQRLFGYRKSIRNAERASQLLLSGADLMGQGQYVPAEKTFREAYSISSNDPLLREQSVICISALIGLAHLSGYTGRFDEGLQRLRQAAHALDLPHPEPDRPIVDMLRLLYMRTAGALYCESDDLARAEVELSRGLRFMDQRGIRPPEPAASMLYDLGRVHWRLGRLSVARACMDSALRFAAESIGVGTSIGISIVGLLARIHADLNDTVLAELYTRKALELSNRHLGPDHPHAALTLINTASVLLHLYHFADTREGTHRSQKIDEAGQLTARARAILERTPNANVHSLAESIRQLASVALRQNRITDATNLTTESETLIAASGTPSLSETIAHLDLRANIYTRSNNHAAAAPLYAQVLELLASTGSSSNHSLTLTVLKDLAIAHLCTGNLDPALNCVRKALEGECERIREASKGCSFRQTQYMVVPAWSFVSMLLTILSQPTPPTSATAMEALSHIATLKGLATSISRKQRLVTASSETGRSLLSELRQAQHKLISFELCKQSEMIGAATDVIDSLAGNAVPELSPLRRQHAELLHQVEELERQLGRSSAHAIDDSFGFVSVESLLDKLKDDSALIVFVKYRRYRIGSSGELGSPPWLDIEYGALVAYRRSSPNVRFVDLGSADTIDAEIASFLDRTVHSPNSKRTDGVDDHGEKLRQLLVDSWYAICADATRFVICADGEIGRVPFVAISLPSGGYLIDKHTITYVISPRDILESFESPVGSDVSIPVVMGNPNYDWGVRENPVRKCFSALPNAQDEASVVAHLLEAPALVGRHANRPALLSSSSPSVLHLATHGFFFGNHGYDHLTGEWNAAGPESSPDHCLYRIHHVEDPLLRSGLALAGANRWFAGEELPSPVDLGIVTAADLAVMDLAGTELVVLSACDTGRGDIVVGQGVQGMQSALRVAGAATVVMSLWSVPDKATRELMAEFYGQLALGFGRTDALCYAQREVRKRFPSIRQWAAFVCVGESGPTKSVRFRKTFTQSSNRFG